MRNSNICISYVRFYIFFLTFITKIAGTTKYIPMFSNMIPIPYPSISDSESMAAYCNNMSMIAVLCKLYAYYPLNKLLVNEIWVHRDLNPGFSPCKGDVITDLDHGPSNFLVKNHLNFER